MKRLALPIFAIFWLVLLVWFMRVDGDSWTLTVEDIQDPVSLATAVRDGTDQLSSRLREQFSTGTLDLLTSLDAGTSAPAQAIASLVEGLNKAIAGPSLYPAAVRSQVKLNQSTALLAESTTASQQFERLNRETLEQAYPHELSESLKGADTLATRIDRLIPFAPGSRHSAGFRSARETLSDPTQGQLVGGTRAFELKGLASDLSDHALEAGPSDDARRIIEFLSKQKSRVPGYPGHDATADFLITEFNEIFGPENVHVDEFSVTAPVDLFTRLTIEPSGETFEEDVHPFWPFFVKLHGFKGGKASGPLVYAQKGEPESLDGHELEGSIVLLDFDSGDHFLLARSFGAKAVVILNRGDISEGEALRKFCEIPIDAPLFFAEEKATRSLLKAAGQGHSVTVETRSEWREVKARNIWGDFPGEPDTDITSGSLQWSKRKWNDNALVLNANYDSISVVPSCAPGASGSAGLINLIESARHIRHMRDAGEPNKSRLIFLANAAHYQNFEGITDFMSRHARTAPYYRAQIPDEEFIDPRLIISLEMTSADPRILVANLGDGVPGGPSYPTWVERSQRESWMQRVGKTFQEISARVYNEDQRVLDGVKSRDRFYRSFFPNAGGMTFDSDVVCFLSYPGVTFATPDDPRTLLDTPADTFGDNLFNLDNVSEQIRTLAPALHVASRDPLFFERPNFQFRKDRGDDVSGRAAWYDVKSSFSSPVGRIGEGGIAVYTRYFNYSPTRNGIRGAKFQRLRFNEPSGGDEKRGYEAKISEAAAWRVHISKTKLGLITGMDAAKVEQLALRIEFEAADGQANSVTMQGQGSEYFAEVPDNARRVTRLLLEVRENEEEAIFSDIALIDETHTGKDFSLTVGRLRYADFRVWAPNLTDACTVTASMNYRGPQQINRPLTYDAEASERDGRPTFHARLDTGALGIKEVRWAQDGGKDKLLFANAPFEDVFHFRVIPQGTDAPNARVRIDCYRIDRDGFVDYATDEGHQGKNYPNIIRRLTGRTEELMVVMFPCRAVSLFDIVDSRYLSVLDVMKVLSPGDAEPERHGQVISLKKSRLETYVPLAAAAFVDPDAPVKLLMASDFFGVKYLLVNADDQYVDRKFLSTDNGNGQFHVELPDEVADLELPGYPPEEGVIRHPAYRVTRDIWLVDESRIRKLARNGVRNKRLDQLHADSYVKLVEAKEALAENQYSAHLKAAHEAWGLEARAYPDVKGTAVDTVKGIIFYFALLLPFSFFMERLLFGFPDFRKQIAGVSGMFFLAFLVLRWVHPAFKISDSPYVIFLAFVILALGLLVMMTVIMKFTSEVKKMKAEASGIVEADVGRLSATYSAIILGISNLRKRKTRTILTAGTIILLTFTVLSFTSVNQALEFWRIPSSESVPYRGAMLRNRDYRAFQHTVARELESAFEGKAKTVRRNWKLLGFEAEVLSYEVAPGEGLDGKTMMAHSFVGVEPSEIEVPVNFGEGANHRVGRVTDILLPGSRWIEEKDEGGNVIILPRYMADNLGITTPQLALATPPTVRLFNEPFTVIGIFDDELAGEMRFLDNERYTPIDLSVGGQELNTQFLNVDPTELGGAEIEAMSHLEARMVPILPYHVLDDMGMGTRQVAIYGFEDHIAPDELVGAKQLAVKLNAGQDPMSRYVSRLLTPTGQQLVEQAATGDVPPEDLRNELTAELNRLIDGDLLYDKAIFERTSVSDATRRLAEAPRETRTTLLNRMLLEEAYAAEIDSYLDHIKNFMRRVSVTLFVSEGERVQVYSSIGGASFSGLAKLFIPILIVAAMVLNTMLGAVYERFREIGIYSSVGLAPNHIGALFVAESFVFATVGAVIGYLLSQVLAFGLNEFGLLSGINLNYSSLAAVMATAIVMLTVLASSIYPARKASELAVPDVSRKWSLEPPTSDTWQFVFPFTIAGRDVAGLNVFLRDYFRAYEENSVGDFFTRGVGLETFDDPDGKGLSYRMAMDVWLAPYDMSISQNMELRSVPTGKHNVYEVHVTLHRMSGEVSSWTKMNRDFLNILRKRFLVWRTVPQGLKERYASQVNDRRREDEEEPLDDPSPAQA